MVATRAEWSRMTSIRSLGFLAIFVAVSVLPAFGASAFAAPVVVIYPLSYSQGTSTNETGATVSTVLAQKLAEAGGVVVRPYTPGTVRADYLTSALALHADYYVSGYLQPIGSDISMILQIVSTHSGSVVFSTTSTIRTYADAAAQADPLREAILRHAGRGLAALDAPPPEPAASTAPPVAQQGVNLTQALRKRSRATPSPSPSPSSDAGLTPVAEIVRGTTSASPAAVPATAAPATAAPATAARATAVATTAAVPATPIAVAAAAKPRTPSLASTVLVIDSAGTADPALLARSSDALVLALRSRGVLAARLPVGRSVVAANAASICSGNAGTQRFLAPTLAISRSDSGAPVARIVVDAIDCTGTQRAERAASGIAKPRDGDVTAIDGAAKQIAPLIAGA